MDNANKLKLLKRELESIRETIAKITQDAEALIQTRISFELVAVALDHELDAIRNEGIAEQLEFDLVD